MARSKGPMASTPPPQVLATTLIRTLGDVCPTHRWRGPGRGCAEEDTDKSYNPLLLAYGSEVAERKGRARSIVLWMTNTRYHSSWLELPLERDLGQAAAERSDTVNPLRESHSLQQR